MNVPLATEIFGHEVSVAMAHYQSTCDKLKDSTPTQKFINLVFNLIQAMSSRIPRDALYVKDDCRNKQAIFKFLQFLEDWEKLEKKIPVSGSTLLGLKVTLRATLEILEMLKFERDFKYLMTATLSQDPLEKFLSVMRHSCGGKDHPDPKMFAQVYRLASSFSLIRPPRGCNVSRKDLLRSLIEARDVLTSSEKQGKDSWLESIDKMLESSQPLDESSSIDEDHDYNETVTSDAVQSYIAGYIVRKLRKILKCEICLEAIETHAKVGKQLQRNDVIDKMDVYGGLLTRLRSSNQLFDLTKQLEKYVLRAVSKNCTNVETINEINVELRKKIVFKIGCFQHESSLTTKVIDIYIVIEPIFWLSQRISVTKQQKLKLK